MTVGIHGPQRCRAHSSQSGEPCQAWAMHGGTVCVAHGGQAPQVRHTAHERLESMVHPAITALRQLIDHADNDGVRLAAIKVVFEQNGMKPIDQVHADAEITVRYVDDWRGSETAPPALWSANGHPPGETNEFFIGGPQVEKDDDGHGDRS